MDYATALAAGKLALVLIVLATAYYGLRTLLVNLTRRHIATGAQLLRQAVNYARISHPFIASLALLAAGYHGVTMWQHHAVSGQVLAGLGTAAALLFMGGAGWTLKLRPAAAALRTAHRRGMVVVWALLLTHRLI